MCENCEQKETVKELNQKQKRVDSERSMDLTQIEPQAPLLVVTLG